MAMFSKESSMERSQAYLGFTWIIQSSAGFFMKGLVGHYCANMHYEFQRESPEHSNSQTLRGTFLHRIFKGRPFRKH